MSFPSVLTSRKITTLQSASTGYDSGMGSEDEHDSEEKVTTSVMTGIVDESLSKIRRKRRRRRKDETIASTFKKQNSAVVLFLFLGLLFCLLDCLYIVRYVSSMHETIQAASHTKSERDSDSYEGRDSLANKTYHREVETIPSDWPESETGKEPIVRLLKEATGEVADADILERLPTAQQVAYLYGRDPVVLGLDTCETFQKSGDPAEHFVSTAGTFNTGTNLMAELLIANCHMPARMQKYGGGSRGVRWQVLWGKHTPIFNETFRQNHRTYNDTDLKAENIFPAVTVRDPYKWLQSMCRHSYAAEWPHDKMHCPNLVPNEVDRELLAEKGEAIAGDAMNVTIEYAEFSTMHESLVGFWNDWYNEYLHAPFPRLIVRFEDLVFHPKQITKTVCECAGGEMNRGKFQYIVESAKKGSAHGKQKTSYVDALVKYGTEAGRYNGFEPADLQYARKHLDPNLMRLLRYPFPQS